MNLQGEHVRKMFKFTRAFLIFQLLVLTVNGADQNSLADVKSDVEALQENLIEDLGTKRGQEMKRHTQHVTCPRGFTYLPGAGRCYRVVRESHDWNSAARRCLELNPRSHLVAIETEAENAALKTFLASEIYRNVGNNACIPSYYWSSPGNLFWTSGQRLVENDCGTQFVWKVASDTKLVYEFTNWHSGEPSCGDRVEFCMDIDAKRNFAWNDIPCSLKICPVCEYNDSCL